MNGAIEYFEGLSEVLAAEEIRMSGAWSDKAQRRYASPDQLGTGTGPYIETVDWRWDGAFEGGSPLVGVAMLVRDGYFHWTKSLPPVARPAVTFSTHGWAARSCSVSVTGSFHGAYLPAVPVEATDEPPVSCLIGKPMASTGTPHLVGRLERVGFAVVLLPASAVKVGRNRLWHLRDGIASRLSRELRTLMTRARSGKVAWGDPSAPS